MDKKKVSQWARKHKYKTIHAGEDSNPNLVIIGEAHGLQKYGKVPEYMKAQFELMKALKPKALALETRCQGQEDCFYSMELDFETLGPGMRSFLERATLVDLYKYVARKFGTNKLDDEEYRIKLAGFFSHWPENLYERQAVDLGARVHYIDNEKAYEDCVELMEKFHEQGKLSFSEQFKFNFINHLRSLIMQYNFKGLQRKGIDTISVIGSGHARDIIGKPKIDMKKTIIIDQGEMPKENVNPQIVNEIVEGIFDMLDFFRDVQNESKSAQ